MKQKTYIIKIKDKNSNIEKFLNEYLNLLKETNEIKEYNIEDFKLIEKQLFNIMTDEKSEDFKAGIKTVVDLI